MKKIIISMSLVAVSVAANAEDIYRLPDGTNLSRQLVEIPATLLALYLGLTFILGMLKSVMDHRLRSRMIDKGVSDQLVDQFLRPINRDSKSQAIKLFFILFSIGVALAIISNALPLGIHSIAIMAFSLSLGFLGHFFYLRQSGQ